MTILIVVIASYIAIGVVRIWSVLRNPTNLSRPLLLVHHVTIPRVLLSIVVWPVTAWTDFQARSLDRLLKKQEEMKQRLFEEWGREVRLTKKNEKAGNPLELDAIGKLLETSKEALLFLYKQHKENVKGLLKIGYSYEEAFWVDFATVSFCLGNDQAKDEVRLSEIFALYLTIYCYNIDKNLKVEDEPKVLELFKEKYYGVRNVILFEGYASEAPRRLAHFFSKDQDVVKSVQSATFVIETADTCLEQPELLSWKLVEDV